MNLNNFEAYIEDIILARGYSYYTSGAIINIDEYEDGEYILSIAGTETYQVIVKIDEDGLIEESDCDCPFDFGPICKHQVAAYYNLRNLEKSNDNCERKTKSDIENVLLDIPKEELIEIIIQITANDENLKESIIYKYSNFDNNSELFKFKNLLVSLVNKYAGYEDFISYDEVYYFACDIINLLEDGIEKALRNNNYLLAFDMSIIVMEEALESFQYADDSNGSIGMLIDASISSIDSIIIEAIDKKYNKKEELFNKLLEYMDEESLEVWQQYRLNLFEIGFRFIDGEKHRKIFKKKLVELINAEKEEGIDYYKEKMLMMLYKIILWYESKEKANTFIEENLKYTSFREILINNFENEGNYLKVIDLAFEGEKQDNRFPGLVSKWKNIRYEAYKKLSLIEEQDKLARELLKDGDFEYYYELKILHKGKEKSLYEELINDIEKDKNGYRGNVYIKLIEVENDSDRILEYVKNNPYKIDVYGQKLKRKYPDEVRNIYKEYIYAICKNTSNRKRYKEICKIIKEFKRFTTKDDVNDFIIQLMTMYKSRRAFLDELSKIRI